MQWTLALLVPLTRLEMVKGSQSTWVWKKSLVVEG